MLLPSQCDSLPYSNKHVFFSRHPLSDECLYLSHLWQFSLPYSSKKCSCFYSFCHGCDVFLLPYSNKHVFVFIDIPWVRNVCYFYYEVCGMNSLNYWQDRTNMTIYTKYMLKAFLIACYFESGNALFLGFLNNHASTPVKIFLVSGD